MRKNSRKVIAINQETGERKEFDGVYAAAKFFNVHHPQVLMALGMCQAVAGWKVYDDPERIRERIADLEAQIKMLEG